MPARVLGPISPDQPIDTLTADSAHETLKGHTAIVERCATAIFPILGRATHLGAA